MRLLAPTLLVAAACSSAPAAPEEVSPDLLGEWRIVALGGRAPALG